MKIDQLMQLNYDIATKIMGWHCENYETGEKVTYWNDRSNGKSLDPALDDGFEWVGWQESREAHEWQPCFKLKQAKFVLNNILKEYSFIKEKGKYKLEFKYNDKLISQEIDCNIDYAESILICTALIETLN